MFYHLYPELREMFFFFEGFRSITFRAAMAAVTALLFSILLGPLFIRRLGQFKIKEKIGREACPELNNLHQKKEGTPTMGGILILAAIFLAAILWTNLHNRFIILILLSTLWLGLLGFLDDYLKLVRKKPDGLRAKTKFAGQLLLGLLVGLYLYYYPPNSQGTKLTLPFFQDSFPPLGWIYIPFVMIVIAGTSNAVNLTDGLDGLAIGCVLTAALAYAGMSYIAGHSEFSRHLGVVGVPGSGELAIFCAAIVGAGLGFLWFNSHPAQIFMGDTGSLALGGILGIVAVIIRQELLLLIVGGIFVVEALSVIIQVVSCRWRKKKVFRVTPLHHHFELQGWGESKVVIRFWILAIIFSLFSLGVLLR